MEPLPYRVPSGAVDAPSRPGTPDASIAAYLTLLRRQWKPLVGFVVALMVVTAVFSLLSPARYQARAAVLLRTENNQQVFPTVGESQSSIFTRQPEAELEFAESDAFRASLENYTSSDTTVEVSYEDIDETALGARRSNLLDFTASSSNADHAIEAANLWAERYVDERRSQTVDEVASSLATTERLVADLDAQKAEVLEPLEPIDAAIARTTDPDTIGRLTTQRLTLQQSLAADTAPIDAQLRLLREDLASLNVTSTFLNQSDISARVSIRAEEATQTAPLVGRNVAVAAIIGTILALGLAPLWDNTRTKIRSADDIAKVTSVPVLVELPELPDGDWGHPAEAALSSGTPYIEALERLVTAVSVHGLDRPHMRMLVTSSQPGEGKSTVSTHLALRLAMAGRETVIVDADLRRPSVQRMFGLSNNGPGLREVLAGGARLRDIVLQPSTSIPLHVVTSGAPTSTPAALLRSPRAAQLTGALAKESEFVVIDSAPVLPVTDTQALAAHAIDDTIFVVRAHQSTRHELIDALDKLARVNRRPMGIVLTDSKTASSKYGYGGDTEEPQLQR